MDNTSKRVRRSNPQPTGGVVPAPASTGGGAPTPPSVTTAAEITEGKVAVTRRMGLATRA